MILHKNYIMAAWLDPRKKKLFHGRHLDKSGQITGVCDQTNRSWIQLSCLSLHTKLLWEPNVNTYMVRDLVLHFCFSFNEQDAGGDMMKILFQTFFSARIDSGLKAMGDAHGRDDNISSLHTLHEVLRWKVMMEVVLNCFISKTDVMRWTKVTAGHLKGLQQ